MTPIYVIEVTFATVFFLIATVFYGLTPWRETRAGRLLFTILVNFTIILGLVLASYHAGDYPHREIVRFLIYTLTMINGLIILGIVLAGQITKEKTNDD